MAGKKRSAKRLQSALEYLSTYSWAVLIVAIVMVALWTTGAFNPLTFAPKAVAGACYVNRPYGPNTTALIALAGVCTNLIPQYVAQFDGLASYVKASDSDLPSGSGALSMFAWIQTTQTSNYPVIVGYGYGSNHGAALGVYSGYFYADFFADYASSGVLVNKGNWNFVGFTFAGGTTAVTMYVNGAAIPGSVPAIPNIDTSGYSSYIGQWSGATSPYFAGSISNIQIYNVSLSANEVTALYNEGIGGAPVKLQNIVGWWPLNGNTNDYSGNGNGGTATGISYIGNWYNSYTPP